MKHLLLTIVILLLLAYLSYDIKSSIKTGEASFPNGGTIIKKQYPRLFKFAIMIKMFVGFVFCFCLLLSVKLGFDLLRMLW